MLLPVPLSETTRRLRRSGLKIGGECPEWGRGGIRHGVRGFFPPFHNNVHFSLQPIIPSNALTPTLRPPRARARGPPGLPAYNLLGYIAINDTSHSHL